MEMNEEVQNPFSPSKKLSILDHPLANISPKPYLLIAKIQSMNHPG
jgi:hypothetical protein